LKTFVRLFEKAFLDSPIERALFNAFLIIFILTALLTLAGIASLVDVQEAFLNKLFTALVLEVIGGVVSLFGITFIRRGRPGEKQIQATQPAETSEAYFVGIEFRGKTPDEVEIDQPGDYEVWDPDRRQVVKEGKGEVLLSPGEGGWQCNLPEGIGLDQMVRLVFRESTGQEWIVGPFSLRFNRQVARPRRPTRT
jgi:hypothetical protein